MRFGNYNMEHRKWNMRREEYISDEMVVKRVNEAVRIELEKKRAMDVPIVTYDRETQIIYQENSDGSKVEVGRRMRKGRYSERVAQKPEAAVCAGLNGSGTSFSDIDTN